MLMARSMQDSRSLRVPVQTFPGKTAQRHMHSNPALSQSYAGHKVTAGILVLHFQGMRNTVSKALPTTLMHGTCAGYKDTIPAIDLDAYVQ